MKKYLLWLCLSLSVLALVVTVPAQNKRVAANKGKKTAPADTGPVIPVTQIGNPELKKLLTREPGQKPFLVNFWATWCEPCVEEFPELVQLDHDYKARGLEFITISMDETTEIDKGVPKFLKKVNSTMPAYLLNLDKQEEAFNIIDPSWIGALPLTLLYDGNGKVVFKHVGRVKMAELRAEIDKLVGAPQ